MLLIIVTVNICLQCLKKIITIDVLMTLSVSHCETLQIPAILVLYAIASLFAVVSILSTWHK
jgi:hypothetical protein